MTMLKCDDAIAMEKQREADLERRLRRPAEVQYVREREEERRNAEIEELNRQLDYRFVEHDDDETEE
jgi:hypothetical protein